MPATALPPVITAKRNNSDNPETDILFYGDRDAIHQQRNIQFYQQILLHPAIVEMRRSRNHLRGE